ncbi:MAG TPA: 50S ribosomal protein L21 [Candidatus Woesebacteria bacterium]|nr:50S ribosomal protein L21 [Candidatus Woesebacteria bacterium]HNS94555.1 50S ribosomal protein L21 [Candidatus Woesebacteria bacterium]
MADYAVVKTGGKQYVVKSGSTVVVDKVSGDVGAKIKLDTLATFSAEGEITLGSPLLKEQVVAEIVETGKGEKIRVAKFKAKVRYRKVRGFRAMLTKLKILSV